MPPAVPSMDYATSCTAVPSAVLPPAYRRRESRSTDSLTMGFTTTEGDDSINDGEIFGSPAWETFADLEFPRENLVLVETLGSGIFGEVCLNSFASDVRQ